MSRFLEVGMFGLTGRTCQVMLRVLPTTYKILKDMLFNGRKRAQSSKEILGQYLFNLLFVRTICRISDRKPAFSSM